MGKCGLALFLQCRNPLRQIGAEEAGSMGAGLYQEHQFFPEQQRLVHS